MKKLFCLFTVMCFGVLLCSANISLAKTTLGQLLSGKSSSAKNTPAKDTKSSALDKYKIGETYTFNGKGNRSTDEDPPYYTVTYGGAENYAWFDLFDAIKVASPEFNKCIGKNGTYSGNIEITAKVKSKSTEMSSMELTIDKSSTCKRR